MAISQQLRIEILERDNFTCQYCGARAPFVQIEVDHIKPRAVGGSDERKNLHAACFQCNRGKRHRFISPPPPVPDANTLMMLWVAHSNHEMPEHAFDWLDSTLNKYHYFHELPFVVAGIMQWMFISDQPFESLMNSVGWFMLGLPRPLDLSDTEKAEITA